MKHDGMQRKAGAVWAATLAACVAGCSGVVPLGNGDGGNGYGNVPPASVTADDAGLYPGEDGASGTTSELDAGVYQEPPDTGIVFPGDAPFDDGGWVWVDAGTDAALEDDASTVFADAGQCALVLSSNHYAEDPLVCDSCMGESCCGPNNACGSNPDCVALISCAAVCETEGGSNTTCESQCIQEHQAGGAAYLSLMQCMDTSCNLQACFPLF